MSSSGVPTATVVVVLSIAIAGAVIAAPDRRTPGEGPGNGLGVDLGDRQSPVRDPGPGFSALAPVSGFDDVAVVVRVRGDRSARWRVRYRYRLADGTADRAFERARRNVSDPPGVFVDRMRDAARRTERRTGRAMAVQNGSVGTYVTVPHGRFGVVEYRFTWTGFAARSDGRLVVGDALDGYPVGANESLVFTWEDRFRPVEVSPRPNASQESTVRWEGPHDFAVGSPRVVLEPTGTPDRGLLRPAPLLPIAVGGALVLLAAVVVGLGIGPTRLSGVFGTESGDAGEEGEEGRDEPPPELLSDEERVIGLLEDNGGRMKQQDLKEELDWSRTKTSNVVGEMQEAGKIEVYRIGRENTLALPGEVDV